MLFFYTEWERIRLPSARIRAFVFAGRTGNSNNGENNADYNQGFEERGVWSFDAFYGSIAGWNFTAPGLVKDGEIIRRDPRNRPLVGISVEHVDGYLLSDPPVFNLFPDLNRFRILRYGRRLRVQVWEILNLDQNGYETTGNDSLHHLHYSPLKLAIRTIGLSSVWV
jgi:hypothetical protein